MAVYIIKWILRVRRPAKRHRPEVSRPTWAKPTSRSPIRTSKQLIRRSGGPSGAPMVGRCYRPGRGPGKDPGAVEVAIVAASGGRQGDVCRSSRLRRVANHVTTTAGTPSRRPPSSASSKARPSMMGWRSSAVMVP